MGTDGGRSRFRSLLFIADTGGRDALLVSVFSPCRCVFVNDLS